MKIPTTNHTMFVFWATFIFFVAAQITKLAWFCCLLMKAGVISLAITSSTDKIPACLILLVGVTIRILVWWIVIFRIDLYPLEFWTWHITTTPAVVLFIAGIFGWTTYQLSVVRRRRHDNRGGGVIPQRRTSHTRTRNDEDDAQHKQKKPIGGGARSSGLRCRFLRLRINGGIHIHRAIVDFLLRHGFFEGVTTNGRHVLMLLNSEVVLWPCGFVLLLFLMKVVSELVHANVQLYGIVNNYRIDRERNFVTY